jgi:methyl-accepting chemotaxis protein
MDQRQQQPHVPIRLRVRLSPARTHEEHASVVAEQIGKVALEVVEVTKVGQEQANEVRDGLQQAREASVQSARAIQLLGENGEEINTTVMELTDLARRLNLLALNTAIEAVRAGEQGQGFALIAQEMRALSSCCAEALRTMAARLKMMQSEIAVASQHVDTSIKQVTTQLESVARVSMALDALGIVAEQVNALAQGLGAASPALPASTAQQTIAAHQPEDISSPH